MTQRADDVRVTCPLFQEEYGGSIPTSALQLFVSKTDKKKALALNQEWHSRLPQFEASKVGRVVPYSAEYNNVVYAVAFWSDPIARAFNGKNYWELRRMAVAPDAPRNTASRFLAIMTKMIRKECPHIVKLLSYQDAEVHTGGIYRACGWYRANESKTCNWSTHPRPGIEQSSAHKIRWELDL